MATFFPYPTISSFFEAEGFPENEEQECDFCPTVSTLVDGLCSSCKAEEDRLDRLQQRDQVAWAIQHGDEVDVLQAFGDPGDGDLVDYL